jgi:hypothetical protein
MESQFIPFLEDMDALFARMHERSIGTSRDYFFQILEMDIRHFYEKWNRSIFQREYFNESMLDNIFNARQLGEIINSMLSCIRAPLKQIINYFLSTDKSLNSLFNDKNSVFKKIIDGLGPQEIALTSPYFESREFSKIWSKCMLHKVEFDLFMEEYSLVYPRINIELL